MLLRNVDMNYGTTRCHSPEAHVTCVLTDSLWVQLLCAVQVWRHDAGYDSRQARGRCLFAERGAGHRLAGTCHRVQLQSNLSSKPEGRQEESAKGKVHSIPPFTVALPCTLRAVLRYKKPGGGCICLCRLDPLLCSDIAWLSIPS